MVTRAELQRQTRAIQLQRQIRSRKIEELQTEALTQRRLLEQTQLLEQQKQAEKLRSPQPTLTQRAFEQIIRAAEGKRTAVTGDIAPEFDRLLRENPELQEAVNRGQVVGLRARELGFKSTAEFLGVSGAIASKLETLKPTQTEIELQRSLPQDIRETAPEEVLSRQNILRQQLPISTVEIPPSLINKLKREIKEARPDIKIGGGEVENIVESAIGFGVGTKNFVSAKLSGQISQLRDIKGKKLFTDQQAKGITRITEEVVVNFGVGFGVGKGFTLIKGVAGRIIPKALADNVKFQKTLGLLEIAGGVTLTVVAANEIKKAFERGGVNEAIFTTIGFVSFGAGFGKTGLKSNVQVQKEFKQLTKILKKTIPKGKRGSKQILVQKQKLKKKKKKKKKTLEEIEELELELALRAKLERRLLNAKTPKEQVKILLEIWRKLKTPLQKKNFRILLADLIERNIFKLGKINGFVPKVKGVKTKTKRKQARLQEKLQTKTEEFFKGKMQRQKQIKKQKQKFKQLMKQKAPQSILTAQALKVASSQKSAQSQSSSQAIKLLSLQSQVFKQVSTLEQKKLQKQKLKIITTLRVPRVPKVPRITRVPRVPKVPKRPGIPIIPIIPKIPIIKFQPTKLTKAIKKLGKKKAVDIIVGMKTGRQRVIGRGLPPYRALKKARRFVDTNIEASFILKPTGKKPKRKDIKPFNIGIKFRPSKKNPLFQVEKRFARLDHRREIFQLKAAKKAKIKFPSGFFPKIKKKRRRKKKK